MKKTLALCVMSFVVIAAGFADGAGGAYWGGQQISYPGLSGDELHYVGGMGFAVNSDNRIVGGFGVGFSQASDNENEVSGGFGGLITGHRIIRRPINLMGMLHAGIGGMTVSNSSDDRLRDGVFAVMGELTVEAGIPIVFFHPTFYVGYQVISSVGDGALGDVYLSYAPTVGFRLLFGGL